QRSLRLAARPARRRVVAAAGRVRARPRAGGGVAPAPRGVLDRRDRHARLGRRGGGAPRALCLQRRAGRATGDDPGTAGRRIACEGAVTHIAAFLGVSLLVIVTPGQDTALTIRNTLLGGRGGGVRTAAGVAAGQATWTLAASA